MQERVIGSYKYQLENLNKVGSKPYLDSTIDFGNLVDQKIDKSDKFILVLKQSYVDTHTRELTEVNNSQKNLHLNQ